MRINYKENYRELKVEFERLDRRNSKLLVDNVRLQVRCAGLETDNNEIRDKIQDLLRVESTYDVWVGSKQHEVTCNYLQTAKDEYRFLMIDKEGTQEPVAIFPKEGTVIVKRTEKV